MTVGLFGRLIKPSQGHLANFHAVPEPYRPLEAIHQLKCNVTLEARIDKARCRVNQQTETAQ
jgi:hypothetical protein